MSDGGWRRRPDVEGRAPATWRYLLPAAGLVMLVGGILHPPGLDGGDFVAHTVAMLGHPSWGPSHALALIGAFLLVPGLFDARRSRAFATAAGVALGPAILGSLVWCVEGTFHLLAMRDHAALVAGAPTPMLDAHLSLAIIAYPAVNLPLGLLALGLARTWPIHLKPLGWLGAVGGALYGVSAPLVILSRNVEYSFLFPVGATLVSVWLVAAGAVGVPPNQQRDRQRESNAADDGERDERDAGHPGDAQAPE